MIAVEDILFITKLGLRVKQLRLTKNLTQQELSLESEIGKSMISRIESRKMNPTLRTLHRISKALDVPLSDFFND